MDIQKMLSERFGVSMTYMDVRFLIDDLDLQIKEEATEAPQEAKANDESPSDAEDAQHGAPQGVTVELDPVQRPDAVAGGKVTFSDGVTATWELDMEGRLRLGGAPEGYRPSQEDVSEFQNRLRTLLGA